MQGLLAGAIIGDFVKGPVPEQWPNALKIGTRLHRRIDTLSNRNPNISATANRFPKSMRRYAPIFVDLIADRLLAQRWKDYYAIDIKDFSQLCYDALRSYEDYLPQRGQRFVKYMVTEDLLANYATERSLADGITSVLRRLEHRVSLDHAQVLSTTLAVADASEAEFALYYAQLRCDVANFTG